MEFNQFSFWLLCSALVALVSAVAWFLNSLLIEIRGVRIEMNSLNEKLAHVVTNQDWHGKEILRLESRLNSLENKQ
jgi:hypothetical protein